MCNTCNIALKAYREGTRPLWEAYEKSVESLYTLKEVIPFFEAYNAAIKPLYEVYVNATRNCKDHV